MLNGLPFFSHAPSSKPRNNTCKRCGISYSLNENICPNCSNFTNKEAEDFKNNLINAKADTNKGMGYLFFFLAILIIIIFVVANTYQGGQTGLITRSFYALNKLHF